MLHRRVNLRSCYFREMADRSLERLRRARLAADRCLHDEGVHRQAMTAVFALEDTLFALEEIARVYERPRHGSSREDHPASDAA